MTANGLFQIALFLCALLLLAKPLGNYMAAVHDGRRTWMTRLLFPVERVIYRLLGVDPNAEMRWTGYAAALMAFSLVGFVVVYGWQRCQSCLPLNPQALGPVSSDSSFNTAVSFITNTNWQGYGGETTMSYLTQTLALTTQNFASAASGMAVLVALVRGLARRSSETIGNFWVDLVRSTLYVLLPLSLVVAVLLVSQGVVQTIGPYQMATLTVANDASGTQVLPLGPAASQVAIKQLGTNGGGFFNVNSAHPFENPTPFCNFIELVSILLIPAALCHTFGRMVGDARQGWALLAAMTIVFVALLVPCVCLEQRGTPTLAAMGADIIASERQSGGNMEGKETRFGIVNSALWATATTAASNGSVNSMHDSFTPLAGAIPLWLMQLGEVIFGGVGSGLYGMLLFAIVAVFVGGLMVGRTPEYLGKKIEPFEMKMAAIGILAPCAVVLIGAAVAVVTPQGKAAMLNPGTHGFSEVLYAYSSAGNNNGSAFAGLGANTPFYNATLGIAMLVGRFWVMVPVLAIAGSLGRKKIVPASSGTMPTHTPLFVGLLISTIIIVGALTFVPALALGPVAEELMMVSGER